MGLRHPHPASAGRVICREHGRTGPQRAVAMRAIGHRIDHGLSQTGLPPSGHAPARDRAAGGRDHELSRPGVRRSGSRPYAGNIDRAAALDAPDIDHLATFYEQLAAWRRVPDDDDDWITPDTGDGWRIGLQRPPTTCRPTGRTRTVRSRSKPMRVTGHGRREQQARTELARINRELKQLCVQLAALRERRAALHSELGEQGLPRQ